MRKFIWSVQGQNSAIWKAYVAQNLLRGLNNLTIYVHVKEIAFFKNNKCIVSRRRELRAGLTSAISCVSCGYRNKLNITFPILLVVTQTSA